jgi:hypothetical protein
MTSKEYKAKKKAEDKSMKKWVIEYWEMTGPWTNKMRFEHVEAIDGKAAIELAKRKIGAYNPARGFSVLRDDD